MRTHRWSPLLVAGTLALAACGGSDDAADTQPPASTTASGVDTTTAPDDTTPAGDDECTAERVGGTVTHTVFAETSGLDPTVSGGAGVSGGTEMVALYDSLMRYNRDTGDYDPWVAESLVANTDASAWTLTLQDGIEFGNGDPLTADAVKASIARHQDPDLHSRWLGLTSNIAEMNVVDDLTLEFTLTEPFGAFPYVLAAEPGLIVNTRVVDELGAETFNVSPVGAGVGPFEFVSLAPGERIEMKAKTDYWGGPVCIESLNFVRITGAQANLDALENGDVQSVFLREPRVIADARSEGINEVTTLQHGGEMLLLNDGFEGADVPTADVRVRQAIAYAIDTNVVDQRVNSGTGIPSSAIFPEQSRFYQGLEGPAYDPDLARQLVEEAKADGWDGKIEFACDNSPARIDTSIAIESQLKAVGFDVELINNLTIGQLISKIRVDHDYEIGCWGLSATEALPWVKLDELYSSTNPSNHTGYADADFDAALKELKAAGDLDSQKAALAKIQEIWNETVPGILVSTSEETIAMADNLHGVRHGHNTYVYFGDAYLDS